MSPTRSHRWSLVVFVMIRGGNLHGAGQRAGRHGTRPSGAGRCRRSADPGSV